MNFREMSRKKFQSFLTVGEPYGTLWVSIGLLQYVLKCPAPKLALEI